MLGFCVRRLRLLPFVASPMRLLSAGAGLEQAAKLPSTGHDAAKPMAAVDYLVNRCNFPMAKALKAAKQLPIKLKSPCNSDAVLAFLRRAGLSDADADAAVALCPRILCADVDATLRPKAAELAELGFSTAQIAKLLVVAPRGFCSPRLIDNVKYLLKLFGSNEDVLQTAKNNYVLLSSIETVLAPNLALLQECGLGARQIARLTCSWLFTRRPDAVRAMIARIDELAVPRGSFAYSDALLCADKMTKANMDAKLAFLRQLGWSETEVLSMIHRKPLLLVLSQQRLQRTLEFLAKTVGMDMAEIARKCRLLYFSLDQRLLPRYIVMKALWEMELSDTSYAAAVWISEEKFMEKFVRQNEGKIPGIVDTYTAAKLKPKLTRNQARTVGHSASPTACQ